MNGFTIKKEHILVILIPKSTLLIHYRNFDGKEYFNYQLLIYGIKREELFIEKINKFVGDFIDVEEVESKKLDFWSDAYQIGEFKFDKYEEIITPFEKEDWMAKYQSLCEFFYQKHDSHTKDSVRWRKLIESLEFFLKKEIGNSETKNDFLEGKQEVINPNKKIIGLANKMFNLIEQYKIEQKNRVTFLLLYSIT